MMNTHTPQANLTAGRGLLWPTPASSLHTRTGRRDLDPAEQRPWSKVERGSVEMAGTGVGVHEEVERYGVATTNFNKQAMGWQ